MSRVVVNEIEAKVGNDISFNDTVKIDTIKGKTTAGSVTVQGEGTATTNLQQGLLKCFMDLNGTGTIALRDSFNIASVVDNGTGIYTPSYTNNFSDINYVYAGSAESSTDTQNGRGISGYSTQVLAGSIKIRTGTKSNNSAEDLPHNRMGWWGDLA